MPADLIAREGNGDGDVGRAVCDADNEAGGVEQLSEGKGRHIGETSGKQQATLLELLGERDERVGELMVGVADVRAISEKRLKELMRRLEDEGKVQKFGVVQ